LERKIKVVSIDLALKCKKMEEIEDVERESGGGTNVR
jgi:hypothetical protein